MDKHIENIEQTVSGTETPTSDKLISYARSMVPDLLERAQTCEENACISENTLEEFRRYGLIRVCMPKQYGGYEYGWEVLVQNCAELAKGCASTAWVYAVFAEHANTAAGFSAEAQAELWEDGPDVFICSGGNTGTKESIERKCTLTETDGGYLLNGWATFSSGCKHATWLANNATLDDGSGMLHLLIPMSEGKIIDNWDTFALKGTGSCFVEFENCFVPYHRTFPSQDGVNGFTPGSKIYNAPVFRLPRIAVAPYSLVSVSVGIALGAVEQFVEAMETRINRSGEKVGDFQSIHLRIAESAADARAAESLMLRNLRESEKLLQSRRLTNEERLRNKRDMAYVCVLCQKAVDRLFYAWGGNGLYSSNDIQRKLRDVKAAGAHHQNNWDIYLTGWGRETLGLDVSAYRF